MQQISVFIILSTFLCSAPYTGVLGCVPSQAPPSVSPSSPETHSDSSSSSSSSSSESAEEATSSSDTGLPGCACPANTAGVVAVDFGDPDYATDGQLLTANISQPADVCPLCRSGGGKTIEKWCYADSGATVGNAGTNSSGGALGSFYLICNDWRKLCVCSYANGQNDSPDCYRATKRTEFERAAGGVVETRCENGVCQSYWVNFRGQVIENKAGKRFDGNDNLQPLSASSGHYLHNDNLAVSCSGCAPFSGGISCRSATGGPKPIPATPESSSGGGGGAPSPAAPAHKKHSKPSKKTVSSSSSSSSEEKKAKSKTSNTGLPGCACPANTAGVVAVDFGDPDYATDGQLLTANISQPADVCPLCRSGGGKTIEKWCYADSGATVGNAGTNSSGGALGSFYLICNDWRKLCVCSYANGQNDSPDCYRATKRTEFERAAGGVVETRCENGVCQSYWVNFRGQVIENKAGKRFDGNDNLQPLSASSGHYLHNDNLAVSCSGCAPFTGGISCRSATGGPTPIPAEAAPQPSSGGGGGGFPTRQIASSSSSSSSSSSEE